MSVAIRTATRIQDQDDAPTLGAGQDGLVLAWDNATGAFVATALPAAGLLATGATAGATSQAQTFTNGAVLGASATDGVLTIFAGATPTFRMFANSENTFHTHVNPILATSYNHPSAPDHLSSRHTWGMHFEANYYPSADVNWAEWYLSYNRATTAENQRPLTVVMDCTTHKAVAGIAAETITFSDSNGANSLAAMNSANGIFQVYSGKVLYLEGTAALGIGEAVNPGTGLTIAQAADGRSITIKRGTTDGGFRSETTKIECGTFSSHPFHLVTNGTIRATLEAAGDLSIIVPTYHNSQPIHTRNSSLYGTLGDVISFCYPSMTTHRSWIKHSMADGGTGNARQNILGFYLNNGNNSTNPVLHLAGDKRAIVATAASAPTDADLFAGSVTFYLDESAHKLHVRVKYADGTTLKTGEIALA